MAPKSSAARLTKVHKLTGLMQTYDQTAVAGYTFSGTMAFTSLVYDGSFLWMVPYDVDVVIKVDPSNGGMTSYGSLPASASANYRYCSATHDGKGAMWMVPCGSTAVARVDTGTGAMTDFNGWPSGGFSYVACAFRGVAFDGTTAWMGPYHRTWLVGINTDTGVMAGFDGSAWPAPVSLGSANRISATLLTGLSTVYLIPLWANSVIQVDTSTGVGIGYNNWPTGFNPTFGAEGLFITGFFDGQYIWMAPNTQTSMMIRFDTNAKTMKPLFLWPQGYVPGTSAFYGTSFDPVTRSFWFTPNTANMVIRLSFATFTHTGTDTQEPTPTAFIRLHDGLSASVEKYERMPLVGPDYQVHAYDNWASGGITKTTSEQFYGGIIVGDYLWMVPGYNSAPTRVHKQTGQMTAYTTWPGGGFSNVAGSYFVGGVYDGAYIWLIPYGSNSVVRLDVTTSVGTMTGYIHGSGTAAYGSGSYDGFSHVWMTPRASVAVLRVDTPSGTLTNFPSWPAGYTPGSNFLGGAAFDGLYHWMFPLIGMWAVGVNTLDGTMKGHDSSTWHPSIVMPGTRFHCGIHTEGTSLYLLPCKADAIALLDSATGVTSGYKSWPSGFAPTFGTDCLFVGGVFDGQYIWMGPRSGSAMLIRFDTQSTAMRGFGSDVLPSSLVLAGGMWFIGMSFDPATKSLWFVPNGANMVLRLTATTLTHTTTQTQEATPSNTIFLSDGISSSYQTYSAMPMHGPHYKFHSYENWASAGITKTTTHRFYSGMIVGENLWMVGTNPSGCPVKVNKHTGIMTEYLTMPAGFTDGGLGVSLIGTVYDGSYLWFTPYGANQIVRFDLATNLMDGFPHLENAHSFWGASFGHGYIWMTPLRALGGVCRVDTPSGGLTKYTNWPTGYTFSVNDLGGAVFDGLHHWMLPNVGAWVIGMNTEAPTSQMKGFDTSGWTGISFGATMHWVSGVYVPGSSQIYMIPGRCDTLVQFDPETGAHVKYNSWPTGFAPPIADAAFTGGIYDGQYIWMGPRQGHDMILRFDTLTGSFKDMSYLYPSSWTYERDGYIGVAFDLETSNLWFIPGKNNAIRRLEAVTATETVSESASVGATPSQSKTTTGAVGVTATLSGRTHSLVPPTPVPPVPTTMAGPATTSAVPATTTTAAPVTTTTTAAPGSPSALLTLQSLAPSSTRTRTSLPVTLTLSASNGRAEGVVLTCTPVAPVRTDMKIVPELSTAAAEGLANNYTCTKSYPGITCNAPIVSPPGLQIVLNLTVPRYYKRNISIACTVTANNTVPESLSTELLLQPENLSHVNNAVTAAPPQQGSNAATASSPIFGFAQGAPCIDALMMSWIIFLVVLALLALFGIYVGKTVYKAEEVSTVDPKANPTQDELQVEAHRRAWLDASLAQSLLLQHKWISLFMPCHDQCAVAHALTTFTHLLTLMWLSALFAVTANAGAAEELSVTTVVAVCVLTLLVAQPLPPLLSVYYHHVTERTFGDPYLIRGGVPEEGSDTSSKNPQLTVAQLQAKHVTQGAEQVNVAGLDDVEVGDVSDQDEEGNPTEELEDDVVLEKTTEKKNENNSTKEPDNLLDVGSFDDKEEQNGGGVGGGGNTLAAGTIGETLCRIGVGEKEVEGEEEEEEELQGGDIQGLSITKKKTGAASATKHPSQEDDENWIPPLTGILYLATPFRNKGHAIHVAYVIISTVLCLGFGFSLRPSNNSTLCPTYLGSVLPIILIVDILIMQPLCLVSHYGYRWMVSDPPNGLPIKNRLHPRDSLTRDEYEYPAREEDSRV